MLGFAKLSREIGIAPEAPSPEWDLKMLSAADIRTALNPPPPPVPAPAAPPAATPATPATSTATAPPANGGAPNPPATPTASGATAATNSRPGTSGSTGRPSIRAATQQRQSGGFTRMDMNSTGSDVSTAGADTLGQDASGGAGDALVVNGSVNSELGMAEQNDWGMGRPGGGFGPGGIGGPGGPGVWP